MPRLVRTALSIGALLAFSAHSDAIASSFASVDVSIADFQFSPSPVGLVIGDSVVWTNQGPSGHTSTGDQRLQLWTSWTLAVGETYTYQFTAAGIYP